jgi:hypothetical protein
VLSVRAALELLEFHGITLVVKGGVPHFRRPEGMAVGPFEAAVGRLRAGMSERVWRDLLDELQKYDPGELPDHQCPPKELRTRQFARVRRWQAAGGAHPVVLYSAYTRLTSHLSDAADRFPPDSTLAGLQSVPLGRTTPFVWRWVPLAGHTFPDAWKTRKGWAVSESVAARLPAGCVPPPDWSDKWAAKRERDKRRQWYKRNWMTNPTFQESMPPD